MKLATYKDGSRDGLLVVVSSDLATAHYAAGIATRLQHALDDWNFIGPQLHDLYETLNTGRARHAFAFDAARCMAPLPRAYQWASAASIDGTPASGRSDPSMLQHAGDELLGARDDIGCASEHDGIDCESRLAVITGDTGIGTSADAALESVRLLMIANTVWLPHARAAGPAGAGDGFAAAFGPVAVTPDELGSAWRDGRVQLTLQMQHNDRTVDRGEAALAMRFHFGELIAALCRTRNVCAGSIVGSGAACSERLRCGDTLRIELPDADGRSVCGAIERRVVPHAETPRRR